MKPRQITALVGLNRSGKSTCVKLLERFYFTKKEDILLDGKPLQHYKDQYLHDKVNLCIRYNNVSSLILLSLRFKHNTVMFEDCFKAF